MRQRIAYKLYDRGGVTILMALFAMLVASMVCIVILGASVTAVSQSKVDHAQEQSTLTLQSAGELVRSEIVKTGTIEFVDRKEESDSIVDFEVGSMGDSSLSLELAAAAEESLSDPLEPQVHTFSISAESADPSIGEPFDQTVEGSFVIKKTSAADEKDRHQLIVTLSTRDSNSNKPQYLILKVDCSWSISPSQEKDIDNTAVFNWGDARFVLAEGASSNA